MADFTSPDANGVSVPVATPAHEAGQVLKQNFTALSAALTDKASLSAGGTFTAPIEVPAGAAGNQVPNLAQVKQLVAGTAGLMARFDFSTTVGGTPGAGELRLNNATQISATEMRLSGMSNDGLDLANFMLQMGAGYTIYLQESGNSANFQKWTMTSDPVVSGGYATFGVSLYSSSGTGTTGFADGLDLIVWGLSEVVPSDTDALPEGLTNLYFTEARVGAIVKTPITVSASRALADSDHDCLLRVTGAYTLTANSGLRADFRCRVQQTSASQVTFANGTATFRNSYGIGANAKTAAQYATVYLEPGPSSTELAIIGDITA